MERLLRHCIFWVHIESVFHHSWPQEYSFRAGCFCSSSGEYVLLKSHYKIFNLLRERSVCFWQQRNLTCLLNTHSFYQLYFALLSTPLLNIGKTLKHKLQMNFFEVKGENLRAFCLLEGWIQLLQGLITKQNLLAFHCEDWNIHKRDSW